MPLSLSSNLKAFGLILEKTPLWENIVTYRYISAQTTLISWSISASIANDLSTNDQESNRDPLEGHDILFKCCEYYNSNIFYSFSLIKARKEITFIGCVILRSKYCGIVTIRWVALKNSLLGWTLRTQVRSGSWKTTTESFMKFLPIIQSSSPPAVSQLVRDILRISGVPE